MLHLLFALLLVLNWLTLTYLDNRHLSSNNRTVFSKVFTAIIFTNAGVGIIALIMASILYSQIGEEGIRSIRYLACTGSLAILMAVLLTKRFNKIRNVNHTYDITNACVTPNT